MDHLRCVVERITYQNEMNGFSVIKCRAKGYNDLVTVVGNMPDAHVGSVLTMEGQWRVDRKFGRQLSAEKWEETLPATTYGIEKYLGSGLIKGVGPKFAKRIVQKFGKDTLEVIETDPDSLIQVEGIGKKRVERIKKGWQEQRDIQVLTPMQRGICGAANLNQLLQEALNPSGIYLWRGGTQYRLHDKVIQIRNDYDKDVFNGDIGIIVRVDTEDTELTVDFDGREVVYDVTELDELVLAYATTIHKAQGSEYPIVVMPFTMSHYVMLQRNLLYTGVTRAKKILVLIDEKKAVAYAVRNETTTARNTKLAERLQEIPAASNPNGGVPSGKANNTRGKSGVAYRMSDQEREQLKVAESDISYGDNLFARLAMSKFRSSFSLNSNDRVYVKEKGMDTIRSHARDFVQKRLAPAVIPNDGKQTPMKGHPLTSKRDVSAYLHSAARLIACAHYIMNL